jgi:NADH dehydrogenase FAD-containing subunit
MEPDSAPIGKQTVVVIGGGAAGVHFIQHLKNFAGDRVNLILIDSKEYFELPINTQRLWVLPQKAQFLTVDYSDALAGFGTFIRDSVTSVTKKNKVRDPRMI